MSSFKWTKRSEQAALLLAEDKQSDARIAAAIGITERTLRRWKCVPEFRARVASLVAEFREAIRGRGIAEWQNRMDAYNDRWARMQQVIEERAKQHANIDELAASAAAGASTGLMVLTIRFLAGGGRVEEWAVDTGLLKEMRETERQAAIEAHQWAEKHEHVGAGGGPILHRLTLDLAALTEEELLELERAAQDADRSAGDSG